MVRLAISYFLDVVILAALAAVIGTIVSALLPSIGISISFQGAVVVVGFIMLIEELFDNEVD